LVFPYITLWQVGYYTHFNEYLIAAAALFPILFMKRSDFRIDKSTILSLIYGLIFIFLLIEPGIAYGKLVIPRINEFFASTILYSVVLVLSVLSMIHGIVLKSLWRHPFSGIGLTALIYLFTVTPASLFLNPGNLPQLLLFSVSFIMILSYYVGFLYLKSGFSLVPGLIFLSLYSIFVALDVSVLVSRLFNLVWEVISLSVILFITDITLREPAIIKKIFKGKKRHGLRYKRQNNGNSVAVLIVGLVVILLLLVVLPLATDEPHYAIADPTDSMYPVIDPGSLLIVSHISAGSVTRGMIIVFNAPWENGTLYAHQVIGINYTGNMEYFTTKGVNNPARDPLPVPATDLVGRVSLSIPYLGYVLIYDYITVAVILVAAGSFYALDVRR